MSQSAKLMNWLQACFGLGAALSPIMITWMLDNGHSWRWGYVAVCLCFAALAGATGLTLRQWELMTSASPDSAVADSSQAPSGATLRIPYVWLSILLFFVFTGFEGTAGQWPYTLFTEARDIDPAVAGLWVSIFWLSMTIGRIIFGFVVERVGVVPLIRGAMTGVMVGSALVWVNVGATASFAGFVLIGFAAAPLFPVLTSDTPRRLGTAHAANSIGFQLASSRLGLAVIPALAGVLAVPLGLEIIGPFLFVIAVAQFLLHELTLVKRLQPLRD
jgi:fucose permease